MWSKNIIKQALHWQENTIIKGMCKEVKDVCKGVVYVQTMWPLWGQAGRTGARTVTKGQKDHSTGDQRPSGRSKTQLEGQGTRVRMQISPVDVSEMVTAKFAVRPETGWLSLNREDDGAEKIQRHGCRVRGASVSGAGVAAWMGCSRVPHHCS